MSAFECFISWNTLKHITVLYKLCISLNWFNKFFLGGWMNIPQGIPSCPPGLEYLTMIDQLLVHQKVELLEAFTGFETKNKFTIKNSLGQKVYFAVEDSDCCTRNCCGPMRPFDMKILDNFQNEVIHLSRPLACDSCCFPCCLQVRKFYFSCYNL